MSTSEIFSQVRHAIELVDYIGEHVTLKRVGREFKGLCPFHEDHRPSMAVVPHKGIFHCFVCGTGGDVFDFTEKFHHTTRGEALRMLAQRAGIKLPERDGHAREGPSARERIADANEWACQYFERSLPLSKGLEYLRARGLTDETIGRFRLGFAPPGWIGLTMAATKAQRNLADLQEAGVLKPRGDGSAYDAFRNRVMFPILDTGGRVIAFGGRVLEEIRDEAGNLVEAKYLNSPESPLFNKSATLYGMSAARRAIGQTETAVVVEGYMDVIACHQVGVQNVVATLGTALTAEHAKTLRHHAARIVLVFDSDDAGKRAIDRALAVMVSQPVDVAIAVCPDGKDPCDYCMRHGGEAFGKLITGAQDALEYKWRSLAADFKATLSITHRQKALEQFAEFAGQAREGGMVADARLALILDRMSGLCGVPVSVMRDLIRQQGRKALPASTMKELPPAPTAAPAPVAAQWLLGAILARPQLYAQFRDDLNADLFGSLKGLASQVFERLEDHEGAETCDLLDGLSDEDRSEALRLERDADQRLEPAGISATALAVIQSVGVSMDEFITDCLNRLKPRELRWK